MAVFVRGDSIHRRKTLIPPMTPGLELYVKYADSRAVLARQNLFDTVRYIQQTDDGTAITERKFPMGDLRIQTIMLVLEGWNYALAEDLPPLPITEDNVLDRLDPEELLWLYDEILKMNPVWSGAEEDKSEA
jgi:hypothetical protein